MGKPRISGDHTAYFVCFVSRAVGTVKRQYALNQGQSLSRSDDMHDPFHDEEAPEKEPSGPPDMSAFEGTGCQRAFAIGEMPVEIEALFLQGLEEFLKGG